MGVSHSSEWSYPSGISCTIQFWLGSGMLQIYNDQHHRILTRAREQLNSIPCAMKIYHACKNVTTAGWAGKSAAVYTKAWCYKFEVLNSTQSNFHLSREHPLTLFQPQWICNTDKYYSNCLRPASAHVLNDRKTTTKQVTYRHYQL